MTHITKQQAFSLLEGLTDKSLTMEQIVRFEGHEYKAVISWGDYPESDIVLVDQKRLRKTAISCYWKDVEILGHDVTLLDVLERMRLGGGADKLQLVRLWEEFGFKTPLRDILEGATWEWVDCDEPRCEDGHYPLGMNEDDEVDWGGCPKCVVAPAGRAGEIQVLKDERVEALCQFLISLNVTK